MKFILTVTVPDNFFDDWDNLYEDMSPYGDDVEAPTSKNEAIEFEIAHNPYELVEAVLDNSKEIKIGFENG